MKIPYNWVRELVDVKLSAEDAADRLINAGLEVASVTPVGGGLRGVVVGEIEAIERELGESGGHQLMLVRVRTGRERFQVVCGAPNTAVGVRAAFAPPGAVLPGGKTIGIAKIRGVESHGMLCSERELGLGEEHEAGLLTVDGAPPGADLVEHLGLDDRVLEIEITPNRPDCLSIIGVARELAALTGARLRPPRITLRETKRFARTLAAVRVEAPELAPRYTVRVIENLRVGPSPAWMAARLRAAGLRPISNVVDITNYVLWELGHPLHAFDAEQVAEQTIVVRRAAAGERFTTLDGLARTLDASMLVIADPARAIGLAGVMGGQNSEVGDRTTRVLLESAYFDPGSIRRTSRALGLRTDAAYRFERGADIEGLVDANDRACQLLAELAGGEVAHGMLDVYPKPRKRVRVRLRMGRVERVLGIAPPRAHARKILSGLGLAVEDRPPATLDVEIPSFRRDLSMEDDLAEEIMRVWGYDKLPSTLPGGAVIRVARTSDRLRQEGLVREALVGAGLLEAVTLSLSDPARAGALNPATEPVKLLNPLSHDASHLRVHPLEGVLGVVATNLRRQQTDVRVFEIGRTYERRPGGDTDTTEPRWVAIALSGARADLGWAGSREAVDVYDAKGFAEHALAALGVVAGRTESGGRLGGLEADCHGTLAGDGGETLAEFGEVAAAVRTRFGIDVPVFAAAIPLDALPAARVFERARPLPRFPSVQRDMAFQVADPALTTAAIEAVIRREAGPLLRDIAVFDVFRMLDGSRSIAWRLTFQAEDRTLTDSEVNGINARLAQRVSEELGIALRGL
ncbi:MAG TPA: phenylalanine--tRNA ligase subunit beta [Methylomirabilota bacterium]|nr:phenylalanine--tRNA ligase subunit beta [Methylomirabilota bacterium]